MWHCVAKCAMKMLWKKIWVMDMRRTTVVLAGPHVILRFRPQFWSHIVDRWRDAHSLPDLKGQNTQSTRYHRSDESYTSLSIASWSSPESAARWKTGTCPLRLAQCCPHGSCLHGLGNASELMMAKWSHGAGACEPANVWQTRTGIGLITGSAFRIAEKSTFMVQKWM